MITLKLQTQNRHEMIDITHRIRDAVTSAGVEDGECLVFVPHTTAGMTINENADPTVKSDILLALNHFVPETLPFRHAEGNSSAHVMASLVGSSVRVIVEKGRLVLGTWQGLCFCEFDGPRHREIHVHTMKNT